MATGNTRNGEYLAEGKFTEGKEDGRWKQTYPNGKLAFEGEYLDGQETVYTNTIGPTAKSAKSAPMSGITRRRLESFRRRRRTDRNDDLPQRRRDQDRAGKSCPGRAGRLIVTTQHPRIFRSSFTISFSFGFFTPPRSSCFVSAMPKRNATASCLRSL